MAVERRSSNGAAGAAALKHMSWFLFVLGFVSLLPMFLLPFWQVEKIERDSPVARSLRDYTSQIVPEPPSATVGQDIPSVIDNVMEEALQILPSGTVIGDVSSPFCQRWSTADAANRTLQPFDEWYTHHPDWIVTNETEDMFCVEPYCQKGSVSCPRSALLRDFWGFYHNQFKSPCDKVHYRSMWSSGWSADFLNVQEGLIDATNNFHIPLVMSAPWHYAAIKKGSSRKTCKQADLTCYFLPYHSCGSLDNTCGFTPQEFGIKVEDCNETRVERIQTKKLLPEVEIWSEKGWHAYQFMTRKQLWLRRAVFDFKREFMLKQQPESDCSVIHVRRGDIIFHSKHARKYYPVSDYINLIPKEKLFNPNHTIFLLTDDANAVKEAHEFHSNLRWKYIDRPRHSGSSGGWENQTPSKNPALELIVLMAEFELAQDCSCLVNGFSGLADYIWTHMAANAGNKPVKRFRVDKPNDVFNEEHRHSEEELAKFLDEKRATKGGVVAAQSEYSSCDSNGGLLVVNMLGLLANNLFEAAFAKILASHLGCSWHVVYRSSWNSAFPTEQTDRCFPNALARNNNRNGDKNKLLTLIKRNGVNQTQADVRHILDALTFNDLERGNSTFSQSTANSLKEEWIKTLGERVLVVNHEDYHNERNEVIEPKKILSILNDAPQMRIVDLNAFFINYRWMKGHMNDIAQWLNVDPSCCATAPPKKDTIVVHIRDFLPTDEDKNKNLQVGVYRDIIQQYSQNDRPEIIVVCQPRSVESEIVQGLVKEFNATVQTGSDNIDAFCILSNAHFIIPTTSSTFSQLAALLAQQKHDNVQVHYPTHTLNRPGVTLKVPTWKYHLTNSKNDGIAEFDVDHKRLKIFHA